MTEYIQGIDVSRHQGDVDFRAVAESGMRYAIVKATEGRDYVDPRFVQNWEKLVELGEDVIYRGAYHFARPDSTGGAADGKQEALDFCEVLKAVGGYGRGALPPALDFEKYSESDGSDNIPWIDAFIKTVEDQLGRAPMIYTGYKVWRYEVANSSAFTGYPLWLVKYTGRDYPTKAMAELPWDHFTLWQYSGGGNLQHHPDVPGAGTVDVNRFDGTEEDLAAFAMMQDDAPSPPADARKLAALLASAELDIAAALTKVSATRLALLKATEPT